MVDNRDGMESAVGLGSGIASMKLLSTRSTEIAPGRGLENEVVPSREISDLPEAPNLDNDPNNEFLISLAYHDAFAAQRSLFGDKEIADFALATARKDFERSLGIENGTFRAQAHAFLERSKHSDFLP